MDPGRVVWLPDGSGFGTDYQLDCDAIFGFGQTYVCDVEQGSGGVWLTCCPY